MQRLTIVPLIAAGVVDYAHAADLATDKAPEKPKPKCFASAMDWLNTSASECPMITYAGFIQMGLVGGVRRLHLRPADEPVRRFSGGFPTIAGGIFVPPGAVNATNYNVDRILNSFWTGAKYSISSNLSVAAGVYHQIQNNYLQAPSTCTGSARAPAATNARAISSRDSLVIEAVVMAPPPTSRRTWDVVAPLVMSVMVP
jgi:hypothetical protein